MSYIDKINEFWTWKQVHEVGPKALGLYFALLHCANRAGWPGHVYASNSILESLTDMSEDDLLRRRNDLIRCGLVEYQKGKKGQAGIYVLKKLTPDFADNSAGNSAGNSADNPAGNPAGNPADIYRLRQKTVDKDEDGAAPPPAPSPAVAGVFRAWDKASGRCMTRAESEELLALLDQYGEERLLYAISQGVDNGAVKLSYIRAVLEGRRKKQPSSHEEEEQRRQAAMEAWMKGEE